MGREQEELLDDIVSMLDHAAKNGTGHINVTVDPNQAQDIKVTTSGCTDCADKNLACKVPTLHEGLDAPEK